jgi:hypothetical protein
MKTLTSRSRVCTKFKKFDSFDSVYLTTTRLLSPDDIILLHSKDAPNLATVLFFRKGKVPGGGDTRHMEMKTKHETPVLDSFITWLILHTVPTTFFVDVVYQDVGTFE